MTTPTPPPDPAPTAPEIPPMTEPDPMPANACGVVVDGIHRCGKTPTVARLSEQYAVGERALLCADHRAQIPDTFEWDGETFPTVEPV